VRAGLSFRAGARLLLLSLAALLASASAQTGLGVGGKKFLGNIMTAKPDSTHHVYWNQVTPENAGKWLSVEIDRDVMTWQVLDNLFAYAAQHGMPVKQHTFVWGQQEPRWVAGLPAEEQQLALYQRVFPLLWEHEAVAGMTLWGYRAGEIWKRNAYLLDWFDEERPAMQWLREYLGRASE
jgi:GH35 family endo-1,4-beta-xylanase